MRKPRRRLTTPATPTIAPRPSLHAGRSTTSFRPPIPIPGRLRRMVVVGATTAVRVRRPHAMAGKASSGPTSVLSLALAESLPCCVLAPVLWIKQDPTLTMPQPVIPRPIKIIWNPAMQTG